MICIIIAICDNHRNMWHRFDAPPQSIRYPPLTTFFTNIHLLQLMTTPKLAISGELPTLYLLDPLQLEREEYNNICNVSSRKHPNHNSRGKQIGLHISSPKKILLFRLLRQDPWHKMESCSKYHNMIFFYSIMEEDFGQLGE